MQTVKNREEYFAQYREKVCMLVRNYIILNPYFFSFEDVLSTIDREINRGFKTNRLPQKPGIFAAISIIRYRYEHRLLIRRKSILKDFNTREGSVSSWISYLNAVHS